MVVVKVVVAAAAAVDKCYDKSRDQVDISGECHVTYHRPDKAHLSKVKTSCRSLYTAGRFQQVNPVRLT